MSTRRERLRRAALPATGRNDVRADWLVDDALAGEWDSSKAAGMSKEEFELWVDGMHEAFGLKPGEEGIYG